ncbi:RHS repeat-associated core domain-containing protein [Burkholderia sp. HI2500]|uniref:RHS repeat-associated core domain-containing protein n=1 Tax=Burkholderia sp. HI2500 TaxID=2015358 RepID=UPI000B7A3FA0|nr:RHS repeat-associated core domain-containing protein [Burkholderia sp. HI2500]OXJ09798.1 hypothetical protein CFB45_22635 [Burkholderia sp. HI2500]
MSEFETRLTRASAPAESHASQSESKADTACDSLLGTVKSTFDLFKETFSSEGGTLHHVSEAVNSLASLQGMPSQLLNTGIAQIPLLDKMPGMPAATIGVPHLGTPHAHSHPPSSGFPLPSVGATIGSGCLSVLIGGIPAARVLDIGIAPTCGGITPFFDIQTGSSNTFIGGMRAARMGIDMTRHCNPMGHVGHSGGEAASAAEKGEEVASEAAQVTSRAKTLGRAGKAWSVGNAAVGPASGVATAADDASQGEIAAAAMMAAQTAADLAFMALSNLMGKDPGIEPSMGTLLAGDPTVLIGGFPLPDSQMMWHGAKHGIGKKVKARVANRQKEVSPCTDGHPVDVVRGTAENEFIDYKTREAPAFKWERYYCSGWHKQDSPIGFGFRHVFQHELRLLRTRAIYVDARNREHPFPRNGAGRYEGCVAGYELEQCDERRFVIRHTRLGKMTFELTDKDVHVARLVNHVKPEFGFRLVYDESGSLIHIIQEAGRGHLRRTIEIHYNDSGHVSAIYVTPPQGKRQCIAHYHYNAYGCLEVATDPLGAEMSYGYDTRGRMTRETDANGYSFHYKYDDESRCIESRGQDGLWHVALEYQPGRTVVTRADGGKWSFLYDRSRTVTRIIDPYGGTTERVTGGDGRILCEIDSGGRTMRWLYDQRGANTGRLDRWGNSWPTREEVPALPNPLTHRVPATPMGLLYGWVRPSEMADRLLLPLEIDSFSTTVFPVARVTSSPTEQCDPAGHIVSRTDMYGHTERLQYDAAGNLVRLRDRDGREYRYNVTSWNLRESETGPAGNAVRYRYTAKEEVAAIVDANGNESAYRYDFKGRIQSVTRHGVLRETYKYDTGDRLIEKRDGSGNLLLHFEIGDNGLHSKRVLSSGATHFYQYDSRANITKASTNRFDVKLTYDSQGRRTSDKRDGLGVEHGYVKKSLASTTYLDRYTVRYESVGHGEILIHTPVGGSHRLVRSRDGQVLLCLGNGTNILYTFDANGWCIGRTRWVSDQPESVHCVTYAYSATGELRSATDSATGTTEYQYDAAHRLIGETRDGFPTRRFQYDAGGNLLSSPTCAWMRYTEGNRLSAAATSIFRYTDRNHLAENITGDDRRTVYRYDSMDLLVAVDWSDQQNSWTAEYDGLCRRIYKSIGEQRTDFFWDDDRLVAERRPDGRLRLYVYPSETAYVPFMLIDYESADAEPGSGIAYFLQHNQVGLPDLITNQERGVVWKPDDIDPYGAISVSSESLIDYDLRFPGHYHDVETGIHSNRFRSYSPTLGRYLQSDPAGQAGGINLYAYTANPVVRVDVLGLAESGCGSSLGEEVADNKKKGSETEKAHDAPAHGEHNLDELRQELGALAQAAWQKMKDANARGDRTVTLDDGTVLKTGDTTMGPCLSVVKDLTTGAIYYGQNTGKRPRGLRSPLKEQTEKVAIANEEKSPSPYPNNPGWTRNKGIPGSHSEVQAANQALEARPGAQLNELAVYNVRTEMDKADAGEPMPRCDNCKPITDGIIALTD